MADSLRKTREDAAGELRIPERPRPEQLIERHREWIAASTAAPYRKRRKRTRWLRGLSMLLFPAAVGLAAAAVLFAVTLSRRGSESSAPLQEQLVPGGSGSGAVVVKSADLPTPPRAPHGAKPGAEAPGGPEPLPTRN